MGSTGRRGQLAALFSTALAVGALVATTAGGAASRDADETLLELRIGAPAFWEGPYTADSSREQASCPDGTKACWQYELVVAEPAWRLRVGLDHHDLDDVYDVTVSRPDGRVAGTFSPGDSLYSAELLVSKPEAGRWSVKVRARQVDDSAFRMRAALEGAAPSFDPGPVLPNLHALPPHEFTFAVPLTNGTTPGKPKGADAPVRSPASCHAEEIAEEGAQVCLRFAFGVSNTGQGPMFLRYSGGGATFSDQTLYQRVRYANGTYKERVAGIARWHASHGHYHHHDAVGLQLFKVADPARGKLAPSGAVRRKGFAHREELLREWTSFYPTYTRDGFGLSSGWGDYYEWDRPGNYLDFGTNGDGEYVIRMVADPVDGILESNEQDNTSYTHFRVKGTQVTWLESGRGSDPWDPCKILLGEGARPDPPRPERPLHCPPET